jgi:hypothetical protein
MADKKQVSAWKGLNNVGEYTRTGVDYLSVADNVDVTDTGRIETREGFTRRITASTTGAFATKDHQRAYVVMAGWISRLLPDMTTVQLAQVQGTGRMQWAQFNQDVYFTNGLDYGCITEDDAVIPWQCGVPPLALVSESSGGNLNAGVYQVACTYILPDGRETGASNAQSVVVNDGQRLVVSGLVTPFGHTTRVYITPANSSVFGLAGATTATGLAWNATDDALGVPLATQHLSDPPDGCSVICVHMGRVYAGAYMPDAGASVIWYSKPLQPHLFDLAEDYMLVPGEVRMLADAGEALLIGTSIGIHAYNGESLTELAPYGVPAGWPSAIDPDTKKVHIWTDRGLCRALPFENLTQNTVSVPPGAQAGLTFVQRDGQKRLIATLTNGGSSFNQRL